MSFDDFGEDTPISDEHSGDEGSWTREQTEPSAGAPTGEVPRPGEDRPATGQHFVPGAAAAAMPPTRGHRLARRVLAPVAAVALVAVAAGAIGYSIGNHPGPAATNPFRAFGLPGGFPRFGSGPSGNNSLPFPGFGSVPRNIATSTAVPKAVQQSEGALVDIETSINEDTASGAGTGIVLTASGIVLTNNHVVDGANTINVTDLGNSHTYTASVLGYAVNDDLALIQLHGASGLQTASFDTSPSVGQQVYAVGNAEGAGGTPTVTAGSLTKLDASVTASDSLTGTSETLTDMLATNAEVIPGDSGGALTTAGGKILGVDTAGGTGGGYAVPASRALEVAQEIESGAASSSVHVGPTAILGVEISTTAGGAQVVAVVPGTPAAAAGITAGSTITSVDGQAVTSSGGLRTLMLTLQVHQRVTVGWTTATGATKSAAVTLISGPAQ